MTKNPALSSRIFFFDQLRDYSPSFSVTFAMASPTVAIPLVSSSGILMPKTFSNTQVVGEAGGLGDLGFLNAELVDDDVLDLLYDFFVCHNSQILVYSFITVFRIYAAK